jgi:basic membrane protein A
MEDLTGKQLGPYQIVAPLGEGGMAAVFRAYQPGMERYVALKILPRHFADDPEFAARFQREARILAQLQHPHILPVFDYGQVEGYSFIVMPFVPSGTLTDSMQGQPLPLPRIRQVISQVGDALSYAHGRGLVHRDVKPSNVLIDESGNCLLTDFGLARMVEASVNLTSIGTIMGTPAYMSPEQGSGSKIDSRSDIYSLGIILYEMATGRVPYRAETPVAVVFMHTSAPLPLPRSVNPDLPEAVERVILKALARNPDDRYQTAEDLVAALKRAIPETPMVTSKPESRLTPRPKHTHKGASPTLVAPPAGGAIPPLAPKRRIPGWAWASAVVLLGLMAAGGIFLANRIKTPLESAIALIPPHPTASALPPTYVPVKTMPAAVPTPTARLAPTERPAPKIMVGEVTEAGGVNVSSFNALCWEGIQDALTQLGVDGKYLESSQQSDHARNIQQLLSEDTDLIVTVGFLLGVDTGTAAKANPDRHFAIIDHTFPDCGPGAAEGKDCGSATELANVRGLLFQIDQASFLAGYLAAGMTKTGKVGTFGGMQIQGVTIYMKGFQAGVKYHNQVHGTSVAVLGWDDATQKGLFTENFNSTDDGRSFAASLVQEGADIIFPVAGPTGLGSAAYCKDSGKCLIIGVDTDWYDSAPEYRSVQLSSVLKKADVAVFKTIEDVLNGAFTGGTVIYTLADGGVDIAGYHNFDSQVPQTLKDEIAKAKADLTSGAVTVDGVLQAR